MKTIQYSVQLSLLALIISGCGASGPTDVKSKDGQFQVTVYDGMTPATDLNAEADIQAMNGFRELYVVVLTEPKSDFEEAFTLQQYADLASQPFFTGVNATPGTPKSIKTDAGAPMLQYDVHGTADGHKIGYLVSFVDTGSHFHQVLAWTLEERFSQHRETLTKICASLRSTASAAPAN